MFVGNAWDSKPGRETPWIDVARRLAGDRGVDALGKQGKTTAPGTEAIGAVIDAAGGSALFLFDEALNFLNRHRDMADGFYAFVQNLTVALTGATKASADNVRGNLGRGAKDFAAFGPVTFESICDDRYSKLRLCRDGSC